LTALRSGPLARSELATALGHKSISGKLNLRIRQMLNSGLVEYTLPDKPNSRLQKYRLTVKGRELLGRT
jgi:ATP-dependent DNA helicase RecG